MAAAWCLSVGVPARCLISKSSVSMERSPIVNPEAKAANRTQIKARPRLTKSLTLRGHEAG